MGDMEVDMEDGRRRKTSGRLIWRKTGGGRHLGG
jgi:hypothetical protein